MRHSYGILAGLLALAGVLAGCGGTSASTESADTTSSTTSSTSSSTTSTTIKQEWAEAQATLTSKDGYRYEMGYRLEPFRVVKSVDAPPGKVDVDVTPQGEFFVRNLQMDRPAPWPNGSAGLGWFGLKFIYDGDCPSLLGGLMTEKDALERQGTIGGSPVCTILGVNTQNAVADPGQLSAGAVRDIPLAKTASLGSGPYRWNNVPEAAFSTASALLAEPPDYVALTGVAYTWDTPPAHLPPPCAFNASFSTGGTLAIWTRSGALVSPEQYTETRPSHCTIK